MDITWVQIYLRNVENNVYGVSRDSACGRTTNRTILCPMISGLVVFFREEELSWTVNQWALQLEGGLLSVLDCGSQLTVQKG